MIDSNSYIYDYSSPYRNSYVQLKTNHKDYCLLLKPDDHSSGRPYDMAQYGFFSKTLYIFVEAFHPKYKEVFEFLIQIAEPVNKPNFIHVYKITLFSMYTAMSLNLDANTIIVKLNQFSKNAVIPEGMQEFIQESTKKAGSAYLYMIKKNYYLQIHEQFLIDALRSTPINPSFESIAQRELVKPKEINQTSELSKNWNFVYFKIIDKTNLFVLTELIIKHKISLINEYNSDFIEPPSNSNSGASSTNATNFIHSNKRLDIELKQITQPRIYQQKALKSIFVCDKPRSATIVLPCGAGKTLLGIIIAEKVKGNTLVVCDIDTATKQWKNEFLNWTTVKQDRIKIQTGKMKNIERPDSRAFILITTYKQLSSIIKKNNETKLNNNSNNNIDDSKYSLPAEQIIQDMEWDLCIADETQYTAAKSYKKIFQEFNFKLKIGLTATPYREDNKIDDLYHVVGPKLYEANISELIQDSYLAKPYCVLFRCNMLPALVQSIKDKTNNQVSYYTGNPKKFKLLAYLIRMHEMRKDKILVFCDQINVLQYYSQKLGYPAIYGNVNLTEKLTWLDLFKKGDINTLFLSRVGDTALDLPSANVCIQIGFQFASRRQEIQRLGRIMRRKEGQKGEYNAFFYTIVSKNTGQSLSYYKRQKALMDLGLNFEVIDEDQIVYDQDALDDRIRKLQEDIENDFSFLERESQERNDGEED